MRDLSNILRLLLSKKKNFCELHGTSSKTIRQYIYKYGLALNHVVRVSAGCLSHDPRQYYKSGAEDKTEH